MRPVYSDGLLEVTERYLATGSDLVLRIEASERTRILDVRQAEELRDGLSEWLARFGR